MELLYTALVLENIIKWRVFDGDRHIIIFLHLKGNFKDYVIDEGGHD
jgi:hypothetical protein